MSTRKLRRKYRPGSMPIQGKGRIVRRHLSHRREIDHGKKWYVVRANIGWERRAIAGLKAAGYEVFWPIEDRWRVYKHRCTDVSTGWLGQYLFVGAQTFAGFDQIRRTDGVAGIVGVGRSGPPVEVTASLVQGVACQVTGIENNAPAAFYRGLKVSVQRGPFGELCGIIEETGNGLARVIVEMFGKNHPVELDLADLKAA